MKKILSIVLCIVLTTHCLYSEQSADNLTSSTNLGSSQVELDVFANMFFGGGYSKDVYSIFGGFKIGADFIFTLPYTKIYGIGIAPEFVYVPVFQNSWQSSVFSAMSHLEFGASLFIHVSDFFSVGVGFYYNKVMPFFDIDNEKVKSVNSYNYQDHFSVKMQAKFSHFIGESKRLALIYGLAVDLNICEFTSRAFSFDTRLDFGVKYRFYLGAYNQQTSAVKVNEDKTATNTSTIWSPYVQNY